MSIPLPVTRAMQKFGSDVGLARRRRRISQSSLAERIGASLSTVRRIEKGDVRIPFHFIVRTLHIFGELEKFSSLLDSSEDSIGLALMDEQLPKRVRSRKVDDNTGTM